MATNIPQVLAPYLLTIPTEIGGVNKDTYAEFSLWVQAGYSKHDDQTYPAGDALNGPTEINPDDWYVSIDSVFLWCDAGAEILNYAAAWHELADITKPCPYSTEEPPETWETWGVASNGGHAPIQIGAFWYRSMSQGDSGAPIPATWWYDYVRQPATNETGIQRIISEWEFLQIQSANAGEP